MLALKNCALLAVAALAGSGFAQVSSKIVQGTGFSLGINIPSSGDDVNIQIKGPSSSGYVAAGFGTQMAGSLIFVVWPSTDGNSVVVSPRIGMGHFEPQYDDNVKLSLLDGSGIKNGVITANIKCSNCRKWQGGSLDTTSNHQNFIWALGSKTKVNSNDPSATIYQHAQSSVFSLDLTAATGGDSANPFAADSGGSSTGSSSGGSSSTGSDSSSNTNVGIVTSYASRRTKADRVLIAHGVIMGIVWVLLFPFGVAIIRLLNNRIPNAFAFHRGLQIMNFILTALGLAMGIWYSDMGNTHFRYRHQAFGIVIFLLLIIQGVLGQLHHLSFMKTQKRSFWSHAHIWFGRTVILLGIINGGMGIDLADAGRNWRIVYWVLAALVAASYFVAYIFKQRRGGAGRVDHHQVGRHFT